MKASEKLKFPAEKPVDKKEVGGIDYVNRTVALPGDIIEAMKPYKGLDTFFNSMSFSHKREYMEAIEEAKKPETRQRRIEQMIEMVQKLKTEKENRKK